MPTKTSQAVEDYLKALHMLEAESRPVGTEQAVATQAVAERLDVSAASATNMLKKLSLMGLVAHVPYRGARLTEEGRRVALEVVRHHRLLETYLAEVLGVPWDRVHEEAEVLEHVLSEDLEDRIARFLGDPTRDPHGHPIPAKDGSMNRLSDRRLWDVDIGDRVDVESVSDDRSEALRYLADGGIKPGASVEVTRRGPVDGPLFVRSDDSMEEIALSRELAEAVWVV
jgi:DtxR family transcriptional regulator, Mn-dependent transcriptional regulator